MADHNDVQTIGLDLAGAQIPLKQLTEAIDALHEILRDVDTAVTDRAGGALDWIVEDLSGGSAHVAIRALPKDEHTPVWAASQVVRAFTSGMQQIADRAERPKYFTEAALRKAQFLTNLSADPRVAEVSIRVNGSRISLNRELGQHVGELIEGKLQSIGSVEGVLKMVSTHGQPYFNVYDAVTGRAVKCTFARDRLDEVKAALARRVIVRGTLQSRPNGEVTSLRLRELEIFEDESELPTVEMMRGILNHG